MRPLTPDELRRVLERGVENVEGLTPAEIIEALAVEVSERRAQEAEPAMRAERWAEQARSAATKRARAEGRT